jgi:hypothetical protein
MPKRTRSTEKTRNEKTRADKTRNEKTLSLIRPYRLRMAGKILPYETHSFRNPIAAKMTAQKIARDTGNDVAVWNERVVIYLVLRTGAVIVDPKESDLTR